MKIKSGFQFIDQKEFALEGIKTAVLFSDAGCTGFFDDAKKVLGRILEQKPDIFISVGDLAFTGSEEEFREIIDFCNERVSVPIYSCSGNHDLPGYSKFLGRRNYSLVLDDTVWFFLCNAMGHFTDEDLKLLKASLGKYSQKKFLILMHMPPPTPICKSTLSEREWGRLKAVLDPYKGQVARIFCGHLHGYCEYEVDGYPVTISGGGGAAMIYPLAEPGQMIHHSILLSFKVDGSFTQKVVIYRESQMSASTEASA